MQAFLYKKKKDPLYYSAVKFRTDVQLEDSKKSMTKRGQHVSKIDSDIIGKGLRISKSKQVEERRLVTMAKHFGDDYMDQHE